MSIQGAARATQHNDASEGKGGVEVSCADGLLLGNAPQCGFASTEEGNILTEDEQWAKVDLVREVAKSIWGDAE